MSKPSAAPSGANSAPQSAARSTELTFEKALAELEKIVSRMESGELSLEQALATHKRGVELARFCQQRLEVAQQQVKILEGEVLKPLSPLQETEPGEGG